MIEYWDVERGIQVFLNGGFGSYLTVSESVLSAWRDVLLSFHWDEDFISQLINGEIDYTAEILISLVMKGRICNLKRLSHIWSIIDFEDLKGIVGMGCAMDRIDVIMYFEEITRYEKDKYNVFCSLITDDLYLVEIAFVYGSLTILKYLVSQGADINQVEYSGQAPLWIASIFINCRVSCITRS